jgi:DNA-binding PadR family transcriptional regulator
MPTRYAVLGLLRERQGYGYQLVQRLEERLGPAWQLKPSSVYAAIDWLEAQGLVRPVSTGAGTDEASRYANRRIVYEITEAGRTAFAEWLAGPIARQEPIRSELHVKVAFAGLGDADALLDTLSHEAEMARELREECQLRSDAAPDASWERIGAGLVRAGATARLNSELDWIATTQSALRVFAAGGSAPAASWASDSPD